MAVCDIVIIILSVFLLATVIDLVVYGCGSELTSACGNYVPVYGYIETSEVKCYENSGFFYKRHACCHDWSIIYDGTIISANYSVSFFPQYWLTTNSSENYVGRQTCSNGLNIKVFNHNEFSWDCYHNFSEADAVMHRFGRAGEKKYVLAHFGNTYDSLTHNLCFEASTPHKYTSYYGQNVIYLCLAIVLAMVYNHVHDLMERGLDDFQYMRIPERE